MKSRDPLDFYTACAPEYWQSDSHPPDGRLERSSSWNLTRLREKETKDYSIWIFLSNFPSQATLSCTQQQKIPYHGH